MKTLNRTKVAVSGICTAVILSLLLSVPVVAQQGMISKAEEIVSKTSESNPMLAKELNEIYEATKRFQDIEVAKAEGYIRDPMNICEDGPKMGLPAHVGAMGVHYFRPDLLGITETEPRITGNGTHTDFINPGVLIYEPQADGSMELVAVENLVFVDAWHKKNGDKLPELVGHEYFNMTDNPVTEIDEAHMFEPHYDLHVWLFRENPNGLFTPFNPNVTCEHHKQDAGMDMKKGGN